MGMIEPLECRTLMAGNVSVKFVGDQLRLTGDDEGNVFTVAEPSGLQSITTSILVIKGLNGTTIDGKAGLSLSYASGLNRALDP